MLTPLQYNVLLKQAGALKILVCDELWSSGIRDLLRDGYLNLVRERLGYVYRPSAKGLDYLAAVKASAEC